MALIDRLRDQTHLWTQLQGERASERIDRTHIGIVSEPPAEKATKLDIVAVHGVDGHCVQSWTHPDGFFWLKALQKHYMPEARVITFCWDIDRSTTTFVEVADQLLTDIKLLRDGIKNPNRPIIYLAHNIGGLIVKQVLSRAKMTSSYQNIAASPTGILFFATPHRGRVRGYSQMILAATANNRNFDMIDDLVPKADQVQETHHNFQNISQGILIATFYETQATSGVGIIVRLAEARLDLQNEIQIALPRNHLDMIRFSSTDDSDFKRVKSVLMEFAQDLERRAKPRSLISLHSESINDYMLNVDIVRFRKPSQIASGVVQKDTFIKDNATVSEFLNGNGIQAGVGIPVDIKAYWVHVPTNNSAWVYNFLKSITQSLNFDLSITQDRFWLLNQLKGRDNKPHSRSMLPSCHYDKSKTTGGGPSRLDGCLQFALYMPYLHWDTLKCFEDRTNFLKQVHDRKEPQIPVGFDQQRSALYNTAKIFLNGAASFHPRRSLDQFFYSRLPDTSIRDRDQIITKHTLWSAGGSKMIMVDQLWLWVVLPQGSSEDGQSALLTFFPQKESEGESDTRYQTADLKQAILEKMDEADNTNCFYLAAITINQAVNVMLQVRNDPSLNILEIFREAIGEVTDLQTQFFRRFQISVNEDRNVTQKQKKEELQVVLKVADIMDELNTLKRVLDVQNDVIDDAIRKLNKEHGHYALFLLNSTKEDVEAYIKQLERMSTDAKRAYDSLLSLLDLQQKEANIDEAHSSNKLTKIGLDQADATSAQSQILLLFTIVTIVFAPLSFFTSYFGMNVTSFTGDSGNKSLSQVWVVMGPASGAIIAVLMGVSVAIYLWSKRRLAAKRDQEDNSRNIKDF